MKRSGMFFTVSGMLWTVIVLLMSQFSQMSEAEEQAVFGTLVIGILMTCTGSIIGAIYWAVQTIVNCLEDEGDGKWVNPFADPEETEDSPPSNDS